MLIDVIPILIHLNFIFQKTLQTNTEWLNIITVVWVEKYTTRSISKPAQEAFSNALTLTSIAVVLPVCTPDVERGFRTTAREGLMRAYMTEKTKESLISMNLMTHIYYRTFCSFHTS